MSLGSYSSKNIEIISGYKQAEERYNSIKPLRGNSDDIRPLGTRRYKHIRIERHNGLGGSEGVQTVYCVVLYKTRILTFYPDDTKLLHNGGWATNTTQGVLNEVLPYGLSITTPRNMRLQISRNGHAGTYKLPSDGLKLDANWLPVNSEQEATYRINRKKNKEVMGQYADFLAWAKGYLSLKDNVIGAEEHNEFIASVGGDRSDLMVGSVILANSWTGYDKERHAKRLKLRTHLLDLMRSTDDDNKYERYIQAINFCARTSGKNYFHYTNSSLTHQHYEHYELHLDAVKKLIFKLHMPEVIEEIKLPAGKAAPRNSYATWMNGWIKDVYNTDNK
jgi:hypothetical protein